MDTLTIAQGSQDSSLLQDEDAAHSHPRFRLRTLMIVFMAESMVLALLQLPLNLNFGAFALMDQGSNLTIQNLLDRGLTPTVDFGYQYGLVPLLVGRSWFALLGRTPMAYAAAMLAIDLVIACGLARCAYALRAGPVGIALLLVTMLATTLGSYINLAHACEAALICHALADHASGRRPRALALLTASLFVKPVMAYLYGFLLVLLLLRAVGIRGFIRAAVPAAATGILLGAALAGWFGTEAVVRSLLPTRGAESYRMVGYGFFFGIGRQFWIPDGVTPKFYILSPAGHYLLGSVVLAVAAAASAWKLLPRRVALEDLNAEIILSCGFMHLSFVVFFYAAFMSWTYYYYIFVIGLVALSTRGRRAAIIVALLAVAAFVGSKNQASYIKSTWNEMRPSAETFGLWTTAESRDEWRQVRQMIDGKPSSFLANNCGCLELFMPEFANPEDCFLTPGWPLPEELQRKVQQVSAAEIVVISKLGTTKPFLELWPEFGQALKGFELAWSGRMFWVYRRAQPPTSPRAEPTGDSARTGSLVPRHDSQAMIER